MRVAKLVGVVWRFGLWIVLAAGGTLLTVRAAAGPYRLLHLAVRSPINLESFIALCVLILVAIHARQRAASPEDRRHAWLVLPILCAAGLAAWWWTTGFPFLADDYFHIANSLRATPSYLAGLFTVPAIDRFFRPLGMLAYAAQARLWGTDRLAWHTVSLVLHIANSALVYALARSRHIRQWPALAGALLFLLSGTRPEAVAWISSQFDLWATLFFLLALLAFQQSVRTADWRWQAASLAALAPALLSKESAYVFPLAAALILWAEDVRGRRAVRLAIPSVLLTAAAFIYRWRLLHGIGGYLTAGTNQPFFYSVGWFRTTKAVLLRLPAILMFPLNWTRPLEWWVSASLAAAIVAWAFLAAARARAKDVAFALALLLICAAPVHQFLLIDANLEKSRVLYLPSVGFALLFAACLAAIRRSAAVFAALAILVFQTAALEHNLAIYQGVAQLAERTCMSIADELRQAPGPVLISDAPNQLDGVYFLHTGLRPCIDWAAGSAANKLVIEGEPHTTVTRELRWNDQTRSMARVDLTGNQ